MDHKPLRFKFAQFEVGEREFLLIKAGEPVPVEPKAFRVLLFLLRNPGRLVKKDEILSAVWDDCSVSDNSLTRSIATLRRLLGDDSREPRYIATVQTIGYRFLCPVEVSGVPPELAEVGAAVPARGPEPKRLSFERLGRSKLLVSALALAFLVFAAGWIRSRFIAIHGPPTGTAKSGAHPSPSSLMRIVPLTNLSGAVWDPVFSPDAKQIAFFWNGQNLGKGDLYVQLVGGEEPLRLTHTASGYSRFPTWSPDGREIAFGRCDDNGGAIYVVPALGGTERKLTNVACDYGVTGFPNWTFDGKSLVIADRCVPGGPSRIVTFSLDTGIKRCLTASDPDGAGDIGPVLSPDQQTVAFLRWPSDIYTVPLAGGMPHRLTAENKAVTALMWTPDGKYLSFISARSGLERAWRVPAAGGEIQAETTYPGIGTLSRDGARLAYVDPSGFAHSSPVIWRADLSSTGGSVSKMRQLLPASADNSAPQPSPDGREMAFESTRSGNSEIWKCNADGSDPLKLTSFDSLAGSPRWSPDGMWIAFDGRSSTHSRIYLVDRDGRNLHMITTQPGEYEDNIPSWSTDGQAIFFASSRTGEFQIWRHDLASGREMQVTHHGGFASYESYDGDTLYFSKFNGAGIWSVPSAGGTELRVTDAPHLGYWGHFAVSDHGIYIIDADAEGGPAMMYYNFLNRRLVWVLKLKDGYDAVPWRANLGVSRDGRTVFFVQGTYQSSIILAENFQ